MDLQNTNKTNILIVGTTGTLGVLVTKHCLNQPNLQVNILARNPQKNQSLVEQVEAAGGKVFTGDVTKPETIKGTTKGMHTVIMTFDDFDYKIAVDGHITMTNDCVENKVECVVPSDFITNSAKFSREEIESSSIILNKIKVQEYLKTVPIKTLNIDTGVLLDWFFRDAISKEFGYWGDDNLKIQFTSYEDTARVTAAAVAQKNLSGDVIFIGNEVSVSDIAETYNRVRGTDLKAKKWGTLEDVKVFVEEAEKKGDPYAVLYKFYSFMFDERGRYEKNNNDKFSDVKPTSIEEFIREKPDLKVGV